MRTMRGNSNDGLHKRHDTVEELLNNAASGDKRVPIRSTDVQTS